MLDNTLLTIFHILMGVVLLFLRLFLSLTSISQSLSLSTEAAKAATVARVARQHASPTARVASQ